MFDARRLRRKQDKQINNDTYNIIKHHYVLIDNIIKNNLDEKRIFYAVDNFIPGYKVYNSELISRKLVKKLVETGYEIHVISSTSFWILWDTNAIIHYRSYIQQIIASLKESINERGKQNQYKIIYTFPHSIDYKLDKVMKDIIYFLKKKHFKIKIIDERKIEICW